MIENEGLVMGMGQRDEGFLFAGMVKNGEGHSGVVVCVIMVWGLEKADIMWVLKTRKGVGVCEWWWP